MPGIKLHLLAMENAEPADMVRLALKPLSLTQIGEQGDSASTRCRRPYVVIESNEKVRDALAEELGVSRGEIDALLDRAMAA